MIGEKSKEEKLFYYLRPEKLIPEDHILRLIHKQLIFPSSGPRSRICTATQGGHRFIQRRSPTFSCRLSFRQSSSNATNLHGIAPPFLISSGMMIILTRLLLIRSQSTRHLQPAMTFLMMAP